jgi:hypothetical protein
MSNEEMRDRIVDIEETLVRKLQAEITSGEPDLKSLTTYYDLYLKEKSYSLAARKLKLAEKKLSEGDEKRTFTDEETEEGLDALLGKGVGE